jgi:hypothetical protein
MYKFFSLTQKVSFNTPTESFVGNIVSDIKEDIYCEFGSFGSFMFYRVQKEDGSIVDCSTYCLTPYKAPRSRKIHKRTTSEISTLNSLKTLFNVNSCYA